MKSQTILGCRSESVLLEHLADIQVIGWDRGTSLKASEPAPRRELITAVRGGAHVELALTAKTFRQRDGSPNKRFLRFNPDALGEIASSFVGMPVLRDHNTYEQSARVGTITASDVITDSAAGWSAFRQVLHIVKPEAVISVLDGTLDRFSIGWSATGPVLCTVHKSDVRASSRCGCWPGDVVTIDGLAQTVEYEFQNAEGTEVSTVNVPAVQGTKIEEVRTALAYELGFAEDATSIPITRSRSVPALHVDADRESARKSVAAQLGLVQEMLDAPSSLMMDEDEYRAALDADLASVAAQLGWDPQEVAAAELERSGTRDGGGFDAGRYTEAELAEARESIARQLEIDPADMA